MNKLVTINWWIDSETKTLFHSISTKSIFWPIKSADFGTVSFLVDDDLDEEALLEAIRSRVPSILNKRAAQWPYSLQAD